MSSPSTSLKGDASPIAVLAKSLLVSITEIIESIILIKIEQETFLVIGCYFYRVSAAIKELHTSEHAPANALEILQYLSKSTDSAKDLMKKFKKGLHLISDSEVRSVISSLEVVIKDMGEGLSSIQSSMYRDQEYAELAMKSLSKDMQNARFEIIENQISKAPGGDLYSPNLELVEYTRIFDKPSPELLPSKAKSPELLPSKANSPELFPSKAKSPEPFPSKAKSPEPFPFKANSPESPLSIKNSPESFQSKSQSSQSIKNSPESIQSKTKSSQSINESLNSSSITSQHRSTTSGSAKAFPHMAHYMEPLYDTFYCPLTGEILEDPVTIETGVTYERQAITDWFDKFALDEEICCPKTEQTLTSRVLSTNLALKNTIEEWRGRNEVARIKVIRAALSLASSVDMIVKALNDLQSICQRKENNKIQIRNDGFIPLIVKLLDHRDMKVRCATLEMLLLLVKDDDDGKILISKTAGISKIIKMLSSRHQTVRHASLVVLLELSQSPFLSERIGAVPGGILVLVTIKFNRFSDDYASEKAEEILKNLETSPNNVKLMAENGLFDPLLNLLIEGSEEKKMDMGNFLGEIVVRHDSQTYVAQKASPALIEMVRSANRKTRKVAFKALKQISSYSPNGTILVENGIIRAMMEDIIAWKSNNERSIDTRKDAAAIIANILESGVAFETIEVNSQGHTMESDYMVFNMVHMIKESAPNELNINLIRILLCLTKSSKSSATIVSEFKKSEASSTLIEFINEPNEELGIAAIKLLIILSPSMGHTLVDKLFLTKGLPENLIPCLSEITNITEKNAVSAIFLAKLPHQNLKLNLALVNKNIVPTILGQIEQIQKSGTRTSKYTTAYLEGIVGILVRFTTSLFETQNLSIAKDHNFTLVFTELLMRTSSDEVQRLSAIGLENLSLVSVNLSKQPIKKKKKFMVLIYILKFLSLGSKRRPTIPMCPVHRGVCSSQNTFCLVDANAVERLLTCLDHENVEVADAALSAICTLMDDRVDLDKSVSMLDEVNAIEHVLNAVKENNHEGLWEKSFWVIERFLMKGGDKSTSDISKDRSLHSALVSAIQRGDGDTKQMAERILMHLNRMPNKTFIGNKS